MHGWLRFPALAHAPKALENKGFLVDERVIGPSGPEFRRKSQNESSTLPVIITLGPKSQIELGS